MDMKWLPVSVSPGQFSNEYAVLGTRHNGKGFSLFAHEDKVVAPASGEGEGFMQVEVIDRLDDLALVRLPGESFETASRHVTVDAKTLQATPTLQKVVA